MKKSLLKAYAKLIVRSGVALRKGQDVVINCLTETEDFAALVVEQAYKAGAKHVVVRFYSEAVNRAEYKNCKVKNAIELLPFEKSYQEWNNEVLPAYIWLDGDDPDAFNGIDSEKLAAIVGGKRKAIWPYRVIREEKYQWCIAGVPTKKWAKKVFPQYSAKKAVEELWKAILKVSHAEDGNGIENWVNHDKELKAKCAYLNSLKLKELHYTSSNGTDLKVGLVQGVNWLACGEKDYQGDYFQPNIPSEECFTSPKKGEAEGIVYSAKPLVYNGVVINNFYVKFKDGKAVEVKAETGEEALKSILSIDEGSAYLGECALIAYDSPINNTGILFYNTLFDENASCHLALGRAFPNLIEDFVNKTEEEIKSYGLNTSASHVDFMIGSKDLNIEGTTIDGKKVAIFKNGNWAF